MNNSGELVHVVGAISGVRIALFDFDGVIANTEVHQFAAYRQLLASLGGGMTLTDFTPYMGLSEPEIYEQIERDLDLEIDIPSATEARKAMFLEQVRQAGLQPYPMIVSLLSDLRARGVEVHILSSNVESTIDHLLETWGLRGYFDHIFTVDGSEPRASKTDLLLRLADEWSVANQEVLLVEDSARMLTLARAQGMRTIAVRHELNRDIHFDADVEISPISGKQ